MDAIVVPAVPAELKARRKRALESVHLSASELRRRVERRIATPDELDAWQEVDTVDFLLAASTG
jgi:hypothetical protein